MAVKESQAIGLQTRPRKSWRMTDHELRQRSLLFWTLYILDTRACFRPTVTIFDSMS